jgi:hypothetical protein
MIEKDPLYFKLFLFVFWVLACSGFVTQELLPFLSPLVSPLALLCDAIMVILGFVTLDSKRDRIYLAAFFVIGIISTSFINKESAINLINGSREFIGMLFAVPVMRHFLTTKEHADYKARIDRQLLIFLYVQAFCVTWQFIRYGANDHGGGSMGMGFSGIVSLMIYIISFYLISQKWDRDNYWQSLKDNKLYVILLYPSMLNETKTSFFLLAIYFILLYRFEIQKIGKLIMLVPVILFACIGLGYFYLTATDQKADVVGDSAYMLDYLVGEDPEMLMELALKVQDEEIETDNLWVVDIPRFTKILTVPDLLEDTKGGMLWGAGLGQFKGGTTVALTRFATKNKWALQGTRPWLYSLMIQFGFIGTIWFFVNLFSIVALRHKPFEMSKAIKIYLLLTTLMILFYDDAFRSLIFCFGFFYIALASSYKSEPDKNEEIADGKR